jgi:hypothetical protein
MDNQKVEVAQQVRTFEMEDEYVCENCGPEIECEECEACGECLNGDCYCENEDGG